MRTRYVTCGSARGSMRAVTRTQHAPRRTRRLKAPPTPPPPPPPPPPRATVLTTHHHTHDRSVGDMVILVDGGDGGDDWGYFAEYEYDEEVRHTVTWQRVMRDV